MVRNQAEDDMTYTEIGQSHLPEEPWILPTYIDRVLLKPLYRQDIILPSGLDKLLWERLSKKGKSLKGSGQSNGYLIDQMIIEMCVQHMHF